MNPTHLLDAADHLVGEDRPGAPRGHSRCTSSSRDDVISTGIVAGFETLPRTEDGENGETEGVGEDRGNREEGKLLIDTIFWYRQSEEMEPVVADG